MWQKNNGKSETEILQNQFTAYLATAVQRRRNDYMQQLDRHQQIESLTEDFSFLPECHIEQDMLLGLPILMQLEDNALLHALKELSERERYIFLARALDGKSFDALAEDERGEMLNEILEGEQISQQVAVTLSELTVSERGMATDLLKDYSPISFSVSVDSDKIEAQAMMAQAQAAGKEAGDGSVQMGMNLQKMMENQKYAAAENMEAFGTAQPQFFTGGRTEQGDILVMRAHQAAKREIISW